MTTAVVGDSQLRLYCLPHAGGGASAFRPWIGQVPGVAVCPVQPPGREGRWRETPHRAMAPWVGELAEVILGACDGRYAIYGHSLGALAAFETVRQIRERGGPGPIHLLVSSCPAPDLCDQSEPPIADLSDDQLAELLRSLGGTSELLLTNPALLRMLLPCIRADFTIRDRYRYLPGKPLTIPLTAIACTADPQASVAEVAAWRNHSTGPIELRTLIGGHFAVFEQASVTCRYIAEAIAAVT